MHNSELRRQSSQRAPIAFALIWFVVGCALLFGALWASLLIGVTWVRVPITLAIVFLGLVALVLFSDGLERWWSRPGRTQRAGSQQWLAECLHWLSAAVVALAWLVILGALAASILGPSPSSAGLIVSDLVLGIAAGGLTVVLTALTAAFAGTVPKWVAWLPGGEAPTGRLHAGMREQLSWRDAARVVAATVAGMLVSTWVADHLADWPAIKSAADATVASPDAWNGIWIPLLGWLVGTGVAWLALSRAKPLRPRTHKGRRRATHASALAAGLAIVIGLVSVSLLDGYVRGRLSSGPHPVPSVQGPLTAARAGALAQDFSPRLILAPGEQWDPTTVNWYVAYSHIRKDMNCRPTGTAPDGCRTLNCPRGPSLTCGTCDAPDPGACAPIGNPRDQHFYYQYVDATTDKADGPAQPGHDWAVLQYWLFYNYDSLKVGLIKQWHQADWEQVSVLLEQLHGRVRPVEVAFSEHCYGADVPAAKAQWSGTHPTSYVGLGSHANYPTENDLPVRIQCLEGKPTRYLGVAGFLANPKFNGTTLELPIVNLVAFRDHTGNKVQVTDTNPISARKTDSISRFNGYWGLDNNVHIVFGRAQTGAGPASPQDQAPWKRPFNAMLCGPSWLRIPAGPGSDTSWIC